jgi:hypothetical protein
MEMKLMNGRAESVGEKNVLSRQALKISGLVASKSQYVGERGEKHEIQMSQ